jgi:diguanylate cyclase (GGDEF)-like protein
MHGLSSKLSFSMTKRLVPVLGITAALALAASVWFGARVIDAQLERIDNARAVELGGGLATNLNARLLAVDAIVENAAAGDGTAGAQLIRRRLLRSVAIRNVTVVAWRSAFDGGRDTPVPLAATQRRALAAGQALLLSAEADDGKRELYIARAFTIAGTAAVVFCEISGDWLWQGIVPVRNDAAVAVLDDAGQLLQASGTLPGELLMVLKQEQSDAAVTSSPQAREWRVGLQEWRGAVGRLQLEGAQLLGNRWLVASYLPVDARSAGLAALQTRVLEMVAPIALLILLAALYLRLCWQPVLRRLESGLAGVAEGRFEPIPLGFSTDAPRQVAAEFNRAIAQIEDRVHSMATLSDVDRLLLNATDLEQSLESVLERICSVGHCRASTLALLDPHAAEHARAFVAAPGNPELPVTRIAIDQDTIVELGQGTEGLTLLHRDPERHSFVEPLHALGADFFRVWPVRNGEQRVVGILSLGYQGVPAVQRELEHFGAECAARLGVALSNKTRDEELYRQAHYDALTSLPNRLLFRDRLAQELANAQAGRQRGALLYVDLDHFKKVNDTTGHASGDQLLQIVAQRLRASVKDGDTVARLGGDEFTVILRSMDTPEAARAIATRIIDTLQQPVNIGGRDHHVCASIGVTMFPDDGTTIEELMRNADLAMYQAKESGRSREVFYSRTMEPGLADTPENSLLRALRRREFVLHYQPQFDVRDGSLVGLEALVRWQPPREPLRFPGDFIPAAEESGLIVELGAWVMETACQQMAHWREQGCAPRRMALNVSVQQLRQPDFARFVRRTLERTQLPADLLELEITESVFADEDARDSMRTLAEVGVRLSLDDFGTGYSSLGYLREHPVEAIKIDRSFIDGVDRSPTAATLAATMIAMAHTLGKQVVAEGVETAEQLEFLRARNCDVAQGFYLSRPMPTADVSELLQSRQGEDTGEIRVAG